MLRLPIVFDRARFAYEEGLILWPHGGTLVALLKGFSNALDFLLILLEFNEHVSGLINVHDGPRKGTIFLEQLGWQRWVPSCHDKVWVGKALTVDILCYFCKVKKSVQLDNRKQ